MILYPSQCYVVLNLRMLCVEKIPIIKLTLKLPTEDIGHIIYNFNQIDNIAGRHPTGCFWNQQFVP